MATGGILTRDGVTANGGRVVRDKVAILTGVTGQVCTLSRILLAVKQFSFSSLQLLGLSLQWPGTMKIVCPVDCVINEVILCDDYELFFKF